jgi:actin-related protein
MSTLILDCGSFTLKYGWRGTNGSSWAAGSLLNAVASSRLTSDPSFRAVGNETDRLKHLHGSILRYPVKAGCLVDHELQALVWDQLLSQLAITSSGDVDLVVLVRWDMPLVSISNFQVLAFQRFQFRSLRLVSHSSWARNHNDSSVIVDLGAGGTTVVPFLNGRSFREAAKRSHVGGHFIANVLRDAVSFRYVNVLEDPIIVNHMKERTIFVVADPVKIQTALQPCEEENVDVVNPLFVFSQVRRQRRILQPASVRPSYYYVLPTLPETLPFGIAIPQDDPFGEHPTIPDSLKLWRSRNAQIIPLANECYVAPETLFHPNIVGLQEVGISTLILQAVQQVSDVFVKITESVVEKDLLRTAVLQTLLTNVVLCGGSSVIPGLQKRLYDDLRKEIPEGVDLKITTVESGAMKGVQGIIEAIEEEKPWFREAPIVTRQELLKIVSEAPPRQREEIMAAFWQSHLNNLL